MEKVINAQTYLEQIFSNEIVKELNKHSAKQVFIPLSSSIAGMIQAIQPKGLSFHVIGGELVVER